MENKLPESADKDRAMMETKYAVQQAAAFKPLLDLIFTRPAPKTCEPLADRSVC